MPRYWVIAPYHADEPDAYDAVWKFDLKNEIISIGWAALGDVSSLTQNELIELHRRTYNRSLAQSRPASGMLYKFFHSVKPGDIVIARRGTMKLAAIGTVKRSAYHDLNKNIATVRLDNPYPNHLDIEWVDAPRDKSFDKPVFGLQTIYEIAEDKFRTLTEGTVPTIQKPFVEERTQDQVEEPVQDRMEFVLEKYLEDFIVSNFDGVFNKKLVLYSDPEAGDVGQQFETDVGVIDILAQDPTTNAFVVIELKKGRESDKVIGQVLRYMGWVTEELCKQGQEVYGMIICQEPDEKLKYAIKMVKNVSVKYYKIDFKLQDQP